MTIMVMMAICAPVMLISDDFLVGPDEDLDEDLDEPDDDLDEPDEPDDDLDEPDNHLDEGRSDLSLLIDVRESGLKNR